ncbi:hypothetical protein HMPREF0541_01464 [Lacticaseibacillus rhamnosus ATCC 21052]|nr:hypothetical protein HMPREF0541_01464 [Lacticaseibacillus rhamnosus ATCC 21052]
MLRFGTGIVKAHSYKYEEAKKRIISYKIEKFLNLSEKWYASILKL